MHSPVHGKQELLTVNLACFGELQPILLLIAYSLTSWQHHTFCLHAVLALTFLLMGTEGPDPCLKIILFLSFLQYPSNPITPVCTFTAKLQTGCANGWDLKVPIRQHVNRLEKQGSSHGPQLTLWLLGNTITPVYIPCWWSSAMSNFVDQCSSVKIALIALNWN